MSWVLVHRSWSQGLVLMHSDQRHLMLMLRVFSDQRRRCISNFMRTATTLVYSSSHAFVHVIHPPTPSLNPQPTSMLRLDSLSPEEIDVSKLLHLLNVTTQRHLFVVEQHPTFLLLDERHVMPCVNAAALVADDAAERELGRLRVFDLDLGWSIVGGAIGSSIVVTKVASSIWVTEKPVNGALSIPALRKYNKA